MKILKEITLHPNLDNDRRSEIIDWCTKNLRIDDEEVTEDRNNWCIRSNYTDHGCFNLTIFGSNNVKSTILFLMFYPDTLTLESKYIEYWEADTESLELFRGLA